MSLWVHWAATLAALLAIDWLRPWQGSWRAALAVAWGAALFALGWHASFPGEPLWDFTLCYYPAGVAALHGDLATLTQLYGKVVQGFVNMPIVAWLFAPFAALGPRAAGWAYTAAGLAASAGAWRLLVRVAALAPRERWLLALLFAASGPLVNGLKFGNTSQFILLALAGGLALLQARRHGAAGALLGGMAVLKPALGLFGVFFLLRRDWRGLSAFVGTVAAISLLSLGVYGWDFNRFWFETSILQFGHQWFSAYTVQSIPGFLLRLRPDPALLTQWQPVVRTGAEQLVARLATLALFALAALAAWRATRQRPAPQGHDAAGAAGGRMELQFLLVLCLALVASPLAWSHYYAWLLLPAAWWLGAGRPGGWLRSGGWVAVMLVTPLVTWPPSPAHPLLLRLVDTLLVSSALLGGLAWFALLAIALARPARSTPVGQGLA